MHEAVVQNLLQSDVVLEQGSAAASMVAQELEALLAELPEAPSPEGMGSPGSAPSADTVERLLRAGSLRAEDASHVRRVLAELGEAAPALEMRKTSGRLAALGAHAGPRLRGVLAALNDPARPPLRTMADGRYLDFLPVGKGGMGIVYWARDIELNREVALKVIRPAMGGGAADITPIAPLGVKWPPESALDADVAEQLEARFLQEAWITGSMTHPGIVPVYELGKTEAGVPYYTMRFIEGRRTLADAMGEVRHEPLERRLPLLDAFLDVCDTMRYAHSRGVLHRDLKPSNVALGEYGEVVIVDWGLARVRDLPDRTRGLFQSRIDSFREEADLQTLGSALGTPGYMSPEAASGDVDLVAEASDVYSLSAVLFEILTGRLPIEVTNLRDHFEQLQTASIPDPREITPEIPAPLAELCKRGLERELKKRLPSVEALAAGVRRWRDEAAVERELDALMGEANTSLEAAREARGPAVLPLLDRASHARQRIHDLRPESRRAARIQQEIESLRSAHVAALEGAARKALMRRTSIAAVVLAALVAVGVSLVLERRRQEATDARASAAASRDRAEGVMGFMVGDLQDDLEPIGRLDLLTKIGARARMYYEDQPLLGASANGLMNRTTALRRLGDAFRLRGDLPQALDSYRAAQEAASALQGRASGRVDGTFQVALAEARMGEVLYLQGYPTRARSLLVGSEKELSRLSRERREDTELLIAWSDVLSRLVSVFLSEGRREEALRRAEKGVALAERAAAIGGRDSVGPLRTILKRRLLLADARYGPDRARRLEQLESIVADIMLQAAQHPDDARWQALEAVGHVRLAEVHRAGIRLTRAESEVTQAIPLFSRLVERDPANLSWASRLAGSQRLHGDTLLILKRFAEAQVLFDAAYERMRLLSEADPTNANWLNQLITLCDRKVNAGENLRASSAEIDRWREDAVRHARSLVERDPENARHRHILAYTLHKYAARLHVGQRLDEGRRLTAESQDLLLGVLEGNPDNEEAAVLLGWNTGLQVRLCLAQDDPAAARDIGLQAEVAMDKVLERRPDLWMVRQNRLGLQLGRARRLATGDEAARARAAAEVAAARESLRVGLAQPELIDAARKTFESSLVQADEIERIYARR